MSIKELKRRNQNTAILLDEATLAKLKADRMEEAQDYLNRIGKVHEEDQTYLLQVVRDEVGRVGAANVDLDACRKLAASVTEANRKQRWLDVKAVFKERGVKDCPEDFEWAARRCGVELFDQPTAPAAEAPPPAPPTLVTEK